MHYNIFAIVHLLEVLALQKVNQLYSHCSKPRGARLFLTIYWVLSLYSFTKLIHSYSNQICFEELVYLVLGYYHLENI